MLGLIYLYARYKYFYGYAEAGEKRLPGFRMANNILLVLLFLSILGLAATGYTKYTGRSIDVTFYEEKAMLYAKPAVDKIKSSYKHIKTTLQPYLKTAKNKMSDVLQHAETFTIDFISSLKSQYFQEPAEAKTKQDL